MESLASIGKPSNYNDNVRTEKHEPSATGEYVVGNNVSGTKTT